MPLAVNHSAPSSIFSDVPTNNVFATYINDMATRGIVSGYGQSDSTVLFRPGSATTRGQISKMIVVARNWPITTTGGPHFTDVPTSSPHYPYVETSYEHGIINGYTDQAPPGNNVMRGQTAKMIVTAWAWPINPAGARTSVMWRPPIRFMASLRPPLAAASSAATATRPSVPVWT